MSRNRKRMVFDRKRDTKSFEDLLLDKQFQRMAGKALKRVAKRELAMMNSVKRPARRPK